jgi:hypothetical protein
MGHGDTICDLTVIRPDGMGRRTIIRHNEGTTGIQRDWAPVWSSDNRILVSLWLRNGRTVSVDPRTGAMRTIHPTPVWELTAGPNGTFAFTDDHFEIRDRNGVALLRRSIPIGPEDIWLG